MEARLENLKTTVDELQYVGRSVTKLQRANTEVREERAAMQRAMTQLQEQNDNILTLL